jgi:hypothetical protein
MRAHTCDCKVIGTYFDGCRLHAAAPALLAALERLADRPGEAFSPDYACGECVGYDQDLGAGAALCALHGARAAIRAARGGDDA